MQHPRVPWLQLCKSVPQPYMKSCDSPDPPRLCPWLWGPFWCSARTCRFFAIAASKQGPKEGFVVQQKRC